MHCASSQAMPCYIAAIKEYASENTRVGLNPWPPNYEYIVPCLRAHLPDDKFDLCVSVYSLYSLLTVSIAA